jgi:hypothetical protein
VLCAGAEVRLFEGSAAAGSTPVDEGAAVNSCRRRKLQEPKHWLPNLGQFL